ncbi:Flagellar motor rotation protein MotB [Olavius algarvensis Delta 1 endosymbiont]|nr:Flagellar motor rotation protein MotB [Olavius algarvensis Delta 1 endosymbiont]
MPNNRHPFFAGIALLLLSACVPLPQYMKIENELEATREKLDENSRLSQELSRCETATSKLLKKSKGLETQNAYLKNINQQLLDNLKRLKLDINKKKTVIQLQGQVIQLLDDTKKTIETSLKDQIAAREIEVVEENDRLKVIFVDKILFDSGSATINDRGVELLRIMAGALAPSQGQNIVIEGHTDNVPLSAGLKKRFPSNWELSTARAAAVAHFFQEVAGIDPLRLSARGYSFYRPVAPNTSEEGRRQNRRIEIILGQGQ